MKYITNQDERKKVVMALRRKKAGNRKGQRLTLKGVPHANTIRGAGFYTFILGGGPSIKYKPHRNGTWKWYYNSNGVLVHEQRS